MNKVQDGFAIHWTLKASGTRGFTSASRLSAWAAAAIDSAYSALADGKNN